MEKMETAHIDSVSGNLAEGEKERQREGVKVKIFFFDFGMRTAI